MKAMSLEYNIVGLNSDKVKHLGGATVYHINPNRIEITQRNRELFISKWKDKIFTLVIGDGTERNKGIVHEVNALKTWRDARVWLERIIAVAVVGEIIGLAFLMVRLVFLHE